MADERKKVKSALDIAMERFGAVDAGPSLTADQKQRLAEIEKQYSAKVTEKSFVFDERCRNAMRDGEYETAEKIRSEKTEELRKLKEQMETDKDRVRKGSDQ